MKNPTNILSRNAIRGGIALVGIPFLLSLATPTAAQEAPLQKSYSTDAYLACDGLVSEIERMDAIMAQATSHADVLKVAKERKELLGAILGSKSCETPARMNFGPDMYDKS